MFASLLVYLITLTFESQSSKKQVESRNSKSNTDYINQNYEGNFEKEQVNTKDDLVEQISGCHFTNIVSPTRNYYIKINSNVDIFDNVFENTELDNNRPAPFWINGALGEISIKRCQFTRVVSLRKESEGNIVNSDSTTKIIFEDCQFNNCGLDSSKSLVHFKGTGPGSARFTGCSFYYDDATKSCQVIYIQSSDVIFDSCIFTRCEEDTIKFNIAGSSGSGTSSTKTGHFQFINNIVEEMNYRFIHAINVQDTITIRNNTFNKCTLTDSFFIYIEHNQLTVDLSYNTFSNFKVIGDGEITNGGIATFLKSSRTTTSTFYKLTYDHCNFFDITNSHSKSPYSNGGAIQFGYGTDLLKIDVVLSNCQFKRTKSPLNGGAVAFKTCGQITIQNCTFEENRANNQDSTGKLLSEETEGRGGAIYISSTTSGTYKLKNVVINDCLFQKNSAYDGFSIYFDGVEAQAAPKITNSKFYNNFNCQGAPNDGGCITSELLQIVKKDVIENNEFSNNELGSESENFVYVDQSGVKLPDPTPTPIPMPPTKTPDPSSNQDYIDKNFNGTFTPEQVDTKNAGIKQISGCKFVDIETARNYYFKVTNQIEIFNNVFENTHVIPSSPAIFWIYQYQTQITIKNCQFIRISEGKPEADGSILNSDSTTKIVFVECFFDNCGIDSDKPLVDFKAASANECGSVNFTKCNFYFDDVEKSCQVLRILKSDVVFDQCEFTKCEENAIHIDTPSSTSGTINTGDFIFTNNVVKNMKYRFISGTKIYGKITITGNTFEKCTYNDEYFIYLEHNKMSIELSYNTFSDFTISGTNGINTGGIATFIKSTVSRSSTNYKITYDHCNFIDITNTYTTSSYHNGGAIQFGFTTEKMNVDIALTNCNFKQNKATRHGGAIAIQTLGSVEIRECTFENNKANNVQSSSKLLEEKNEGRGGAIYIEAGNSDAHVRSVTINKCTFKRNIAFDGFAIYIEGEESQTSFSITENAFTDNYNINSDLSNRASISSEIISITKEQIENDNTFTNIYEGFGSRKFIHVDHQGNPYPDPTPLATPTPTPNPDYIDHNYEGNFEKEQVNTKDDHVEQISGCHFTNIVSPTRNYYIKINSNVDIFDNVFENTELDNNRPAPFWINGALGEISIKRCQFTRVVSLRKESEGNIVNSDSTTKIIFEDCQFNNCGLDSSKSLVHFKGTGPGSARFTGCSFYYDDATKSCQVIYIQSSDVIFDSCIFTRCEEDTIKFSIAAGSSKTGEFQFINNVVNEMNYRFIYATNVRDTITFTNNTFDKCTLNDCYLINIEHNQEAINLINNSFSSFKVTGSSAINCGGIAIFLKASAKQHLTYDNCKFNNIENLHTSSPHSNGGAIQFGFASECLNVDVSLTNCIFKGNKSPKHGGAVAIQTQGTVLINNCTFEENIANNAAGSAKLLAEKAEGRGGALFISCDHIEKVTIEKCTFEKNSAFDGFSVYFEGEAAATTTFTITSNTFNENDKSETNVRSIIASEILSIQKDVIEDKNIFGTTNLKNFVHVDQQGNHYPDQTIAPTPTLPSEPNIEIWDDHTQDNKVRCVMTLNPDKEKERNIVVDVKTSIFENMEDKEGAAIHLVNCGLKCSNQCQFIHCVSNDGPGGAIYINNANDLLNDVSLNKLVFTSNVGQYGGAIYIYSSSSLNDVKITNCKFTDNHVSDTPSSEGFIGGSAMYLTIMRGGVVHCTFQQNVGPGGSIKLVSEFHSSSPSSLYLLSDNLVSIDDCSFEIGMKENSSIFYESGNSVSSYQVSNCKFSGKLEFGCYHIDGKLINKNAQKLVVKDCKFDSSAKEAWPQKEEFLSVDIKKQEFKKEKNTGMLKFISSYALPAATIIAVVVIVFVMKKIKNSSTQEEIEMTNIADDEIKQSLI